jgi:hypothetical protein
MNENDKGEGVEKKVAGCGLQVGSTRDNLQRATCNPEQIINRHIRQ